MKLYDKVPESWSIEYLSDIADINPTNPENPPDDEELASFVPMKAIEEISGNLDSSETKQWGEIKSGYTRFQENDVLFAKITPSMENGKAALAKNLTNGCGAGTTEVHVIRCGEKLLPKYILYFVLQEGFRRKARKNMTGSAGQMRVPKDFLETVEVPLPSVEEQRQIVGKIEEQHTKLDTAIEDLESAAERIDNHRRSVLYSAIEGELTEDWRKERIGDLTHANQLLNDVQERRRENWEERYKKKYEEKGKEPPSGWKGRYSEPERPDVSDQPSLPNKWIWVSFGEVLEVFLGSTPKRSNSDYWEGDIPWVSSGEVEFNKITETEEQITQEGLESCSTTVHPPGTVLMAIIGQGKTRGRAAILGISAAHNQNTVAMRVPEVGLPEKYVYYFLRGSYEKVRQKGAGNQQKALSKTRVEKMLFPLPPLKEQKEIVRRLDAYISVIDNTSKLIKESLSRGKKLRQSLLKSAYTGGLLEANTAEYESEENITRGDEEHEQSTLHEITGGKTND